MSWMQYRKLNLDTGVTPDKINFHCKKRQTCKKPFLYKVFNHFFSIFLSDLIRFIISHPPKQKFKGNAFSLLYIFLHPFGLFAPFSCFVHYCRWNGNQTMTIWKRSDSCLTINRYKNDVFGGQGENQEQKIDEYLTLLFITRIEKIE